MIATRIKLLGALPLLAVYLSLFTSVSAATFELAVPSEETRVGDEVRIPVYIDAPEGETAVITSAEILFPETMIWVKSLELAPGWLPVVGEEYQSLDNGAGVVLKTAGFEGGVSGRALFGTVLGIATGVGDASLSAGDRSYLLDKDNRDILRKGAPVTLKIQPVPAQSGLPPELFDIRLELAERVLAPGEPPTARVVFQSFGYVPTPVDMFFTVTNADGVVVASSEESVVVETETVFTKRFDDIALTRGRYAYHVVTRYDANIVDDFTAPFEVVSLRRTGVIIGITITVIGAGLAFVVLRLRQRGGLF